MFFNILRKIRQRKAERIALEEELSKLKAGLKEEITTIQDFKEFTTQKDMIFKKVYEQSHHIENKFMNEFSKPILHKQSEFLEIFSSVLQSDGTILKFFMYEPAEIHINGEKFESLKFHLDAAKKNIGSQTLIIHKFRRKKDELLGLLNNEQQSLTQLMDLVTNLETQIAEKYNALIESDKSESRNINALIARITKEISEIDQAYELFSVHRIDRDCVDRRAIMQTLIEKINKLIEEIEKSLVKLDELQMGLQRVHKLKVKIEQLTERKKQLEYKIVTINKALDAYKRNAQQELAMLLGEVFHIHRDFSSKLIYEVPFDPSLQRYADKIEFIMKYGIRTDDTNKEYSDAKLKAIYFSEHTADGVAYIILKNTTKHAIFSAYGIEPKQLLIFTPLLKEEFALLIRKSSNPEFATKLIEILTAHDIKYLTE